MKQPNNILEEAFIEFLDRHKGLIVKIAGSYFKHPADRNDLIQEITLQLWKSFPKYNQALTASTWVYRISLNVAISYFRKEQRHKRKLSNYQQETTILDWQGIEYEEKLQQLHAMIAQLNPLEKAIIILQLEGCKNGEIADITGISLSNVSTRLHRIKEKLKKNFQTKNKEL